MKGNTDAGLDNVRILCRALRNADSLSLTIRDGDGEASLDFGPGELLWELREAAARCIEHEYNRGVSRRR